jgi:ankyrin repeat protein
MMQVKTRSSGIRTAIVMIVLGAILIEAIGMISGIGAFIFYRASESPTRLMRAAQIGDIDTVRKLLTRKTVDIEERRGTSIRFGLFAVHGPSEPIYGESALLYAIKGHSPETVRLLLEAGADTNVRDSRNMSIWDYLIDDFARAGVDSAAARAASSVFVVLAQYVPVPPDYVDRFLRYGSELNDDKLLDSALGLDRPLGEREATLCKFANRGRVEMIHRILNSFPVAPSQSLVCAARETGDRGRAAVDYLIARGADPNGGTASVRPPLSAVVETMPPGTASQSIPDEARDLLELLLAHGANPQLAFPGGISPIELARRQGNEAVARYLETWNPTVRQRRKPYKCAEICVRSEYVRECLPSCAAPARIAAPGDDDTSVGYWIRGSGVDGRMGRDNRVEGNVRHVFQQKPIDCSFKIDTTAFGPRSQSCENSFGALQITVLPR